ncbi:MAG: MauE/DoxX family redox-associated membrane protein [Thermodesulfovibrionales bacterium]|nr:MauE/DoxX family redox-associated membrane protein [Thermodesulfovibrionales bacterium]
MILLAIFKTNIIMKRMIASPWSYRIVRFIIGAIFIYAGSVKLIDPKTFAHSISSYGLVPEILLAPVAIGLPALEVLAGIGLIFNIRGSLTVIFGMLVMFVVVLWYGILKDMNIDCGCFTPEEIFEQNSLQKALYRDLVMIGAVLYMYLYRYTQSQRRLSHSSWLLKIL